MIKQYDDISELISTGSVWSVECTNGNSGYCSTNWQAIVGYSTYNQGGSCQVAICGSGQYGTATAINNF